MLSLYLSLSRYILEKEYNKVDNVFVIPRGINENIFSPDKVTAERIISAAKKMKTDEFQKTILMPGRLTSWKGHEIAIRSLSLIKRAQHKIGDIRRSSKKV